MNVINLLLKTEGAGKAFFTWILTAEPVATWAAKEGLCRGLHIRLLSTFFLFFFFFVTAKNVMNRC